MSKNPSSIMAGLIHDDIKLHILFLLFIYPELNVSQFHKILGYSKASLSNHLKEMKLKDLLVDRVEESKGTFNPVYYRINRQKLDELNPLSKIRRDMPSDPAKRIELYRNTFGAIKAFMQFMGKAFQMLEMVMTRIDDNLFSEVGLADIDRLDERILSFVFPVAKIDFTGFLISEANLPKFHQLYRYFIDQASFLEREDAKQGTEKSVISFSAMIPMVEMLKALLDNEDPENFE